MTLPEQGHLLRIFVGENKKVGRVPLYEWIVRKARGERGLAGATAIRGLAGFGARSQIHTAKVLRLSTDLPVVIEIVDTREKLEAFLDELDGAIPTVSPPSNGSRSASTAEATSPSPPRPRWALRPRELPELHR